MKFIETLEKAFDKKASLDFYPKQKGDVIKTGADTSLIQDWINYRPFTSLEKGIMIFTEWYKKSNAIKYC